jgi:hypothetical protein
MILEPASVQEEILRAARLLMAPGAVHEVRIPKTRQGTISGYFNCPEALADAVLGLDGKVEGIYITLNPCKLALLARAANRLKERAAVTTSDHDIERRQWLLLDFDPVRPAGVSASDYEHARAITVACATEDELHGAGFPDPVVCDSGNGAHLLYSVKLPNDLRSTAVVKSALRGIAARCETDDVKVDLAVFNAARIVKLYGTLTCKGDHVSERPHRRSRILEIPDQLRALEVRQ